MEEVCAQVHGGDEEEGAGADEAMLWSIQEALEKQTLQIGASACGATAVVDVLKALGVDVAPEEADRCVQTRLRRNESPLPDYLLSRSEAGKCFWYTDTRPELDMIIVLFTPLHLSDSLSYSLLFRLRIFSYFLR